MNLEAADYEYVKQTFNKLIQYFHAQAFTVEANQALYRGMVYDDKPLHVSFLGAPPAEKVTSFQRCNKPHFPMFYCSVDPGVVLSEINVNVADKVYMSKWRVVSTDFLLTNVVPDLPEEVWYPALEVLYTFVETKFAQPIHETFSDQYKVTVAITEVLASRNINGNSNGRGIGGVFYPSVAHPSRAENVALYPDIADQFLTLDYVEEIEIVRCEKSEIHIRYTNISTEFAEGRIHWEGRPRHWQLNRGDTVRFVNDGNGWSALDHQDNVFDPS